MLQDGRDMFWSMAPLIVACIVLAGLLGMCSFQASGPTMGNIPSYDAAGALQADAEIMAFPIRLPAVPEDWQSNSGRRGGLEAARTDPDTGAQVRALVSTVGYITGAGHYLSLSQSDADEARLVASIQPDVVPTGTADVDGLTWVVYDGGERDEPVWTALLPAPQGETRLAITGAGTVDEFRTLARATQSQAPLAPRA